MNGPLFELHAIQYFPFMKYRSESIFHYTILKINIHRKTKFFRNRKSILELFNKT